MDRLISYGAGLGYATIFGFSFLVTKGALDALDPLELLFSRFLVAALAMSALAALRVIRIDFRGKPKGILALVCLFQPILYFAFETYGVRECATSVAGMVLGALPASVAILGFLILREKVGAAQGVGLALSVIGVTAVTLASTGPGAGTSSVRGVLFLFGSMASAAFFSVFSRAASRHYSNVERTFAMMWTGAIAFGIAAAVSGTAAGAAGATSVLASRGDLPSRMAAAWLSLAYLGLFSSVLAFFFMNVTLARLKASQSAVFANLVTVITVGAGVLLRGESFGAVQAAGSLAIVAGVWLANRPGSADLRSLDASKNAPHDP